jgi:hypothetical protein
LNSHSANIVELCTSLHTIFFTLQRVLCCDGIVSDCLKQDVVPIHKTASVNEPTPTGESDEDVKPVPLPRNFGSVKVHFTARAFPTPKRESQAPEEEEVTRFHK